ncbi:hypothetical protein FH972_022325 [Carpinus fangiana]|uniref:Uncharacterized protein n=1 Tax=Carpinus fangiana TaxID=176857 RepID=A0A5N6KSH1_9ROSI|nr:hypothetical protein FH972_022325 [Carpinus fangiana]
MSFSAPSNVSREDLAHTTPMTTSRQRPEAVICPTDDDAVVPRRNSAESRHALDKRSPEYIWKSGLAGGLAGCAAKTVVGPLDRVKILFQASNPQFAKYTGSWFGVATAMKDIYHTTGVRGLFRGHSATLLRIFPYAGIKFLAYEQVRAVFIPGPAQETPARRFISGSLAGTLSVFFTYPLEVIRVRLAFETKSQNRATLSSICRQIYNEQPPTPPAPAASGTAGQTVLRSSAPAVPVIPIPKHGMTNFYRGFTPTLWGMLPYAGSSFLTHDLVGDLLRRPELAAYTTIPNTKGSSTTGRNPNRPAQLTSWAQLFAGGVAGFVSQTVSYPLEVIRRRMQVGGAVGDGRRQTMAEIAKIVFKEKGWRGFFVGLSIGYVKVVPMSATSFYVYERSKFYLGI